VLEVEGFESGEGREEVDEGLGPEMADKNQRRQLGRWFQEAKKLNIEGFPFRDMRGHGILDLEVAQVGKVAKVTRQERAGRVEDLKLGQII